MKNHTKTILRTSNSFRRCICDSEKMKFLVIYMLALLGTINANRAKRGIFGSAEADAAHGGFSGSLQDFGKAGQSFSHAGQHFGSADQSYSNAGQDLRSSGQSYSSAGQDFGSAEQDLSNAGKVFSDAGSYNYQKPESVQTQRSESTERQKYPVEVQRTIVKTVHVERPVAQPYNVIKSVPAPYPVERVRSVVKEVRVPQPYAVYKDVVKRVNVERIIPKPYPVEKVVRVPVERHVPVYIENQQQQKGLGSYQQGGYQAQSYNTIPQAPSSTYGVPQSHGY